MDEDVGTGIEGTAGLATAFGMYANRQLMSACRMDDRSQRRIVHWRGTAVKHHFDQVVTMTGSLVDRAYAVGRSCQFAYGLRWSPCPIGRVPADHSEEWSGHPWVDRPSSCVQCAVPNPGREPQPPRCQTVQRH